MSTRTPAPIGAPLSAQFELREVCNTWAGASRIMPVVSARFELRRSGGWYLIVDACPFCGQKHSHGSGQPPVWNAQNSLNPVVYAQKPKFSHCTNGERRVYLLQITAGLPREVR